MRKARSAVFIARDRYGLQQATDARTLASAPGMFTSVFKQRSVSASGRPSGASFFWPTARMLDGPVHFQDNLALRTRTSVSASPGLEPQRKVDAGLRHLPIYLWHINILGAGHPYMALRTLSTCFSRKLLQARWRSSARLQCSTWSQVNLWWPCAYGLSKIVIRKRSTRLNVRT